MRTDSGSLDVMYAHISIQRGLLFEESVGFLFSISLQSPQQTHYFASRIYGIQKNTNIVLKSHVLSSGRLSFQ